MRPAFILVSAYEVKDDTPKAFEEGRAWGEEDPPVSFYINPLIIPAFQCTDMFVVMTVDGKKYAIDLGASENDQFWHRFLDPDVQTPFVMLQPRTSRFSGIFVHIDQIAEITWTDKEMTTARVRLAANDGGDAVTHDVVHPHCIERLKYLCQFYSYWRTREESQREFQAGKRSQSTTTKETK